MNNNSNNNSNNNLLLNGGFDKDNYKNKDVYRLLDSGINRWEPLFFNPQDNYNVPFSNNLSSRILEKDYYNLKNQNQN